MTRAHDSITPQQERHQAQLLAALALALLLALPVILPIWLLTHREYTIGPVIAVGLVALLLTIYALSRSRHHRIGAFLLVAHPVLLVPVTALTVRLPVSEWLPVLNFFVISTVLASMLLNLRMTLYISVAGFLTAAAFMLVPGVAFYTVFGFIVTMTITSALVVVATGVYSHSSHSLYTSESRYRALFEQSADAVFLFDVKGVNIEWNPRARAMLGYAPEEVVGLSHQRVIVEAQIADAEAMLMRLVAGELIAPYERTFRRKDGTQFVGEVKLTLIRDTDGRPLHVQSLVRDITERKRAEQVLRESAERYRQMFENNLVVALLLDAQTGSIVDANKSAVRYYGYSREQLITMPIDDIHFTPALDRAELLARLQRVEEGQFASQHRLRGGDVRDVEVYCGPVIIEDRLYLYTIITDVTERNQAQAALMQSEERFATAFHSSPVPMVITTSDADNPVFVEANEAFLSMVGYTWEELAGRTILDLHITIHSQSRDERLKTLAEKRRYTTQEARICNRAGEVLDVIISAQRTYMGGREYDLEIILDVTERKRLLDQQIALKLEKERVQVLRSFVQNASHELRTPLSVINSSMYFMTRSADEQQRRQYAARVEQQTMRLTRLLDMVIDMTKLDTSTPFNLQFSDVNSLVFQVFNRFTHIAREKQIDLRFVPDTGVPLLPLDAAWFEKALDHLLDNAIRFTPQGGEVSLCTLNEPDAVIIQIIDSGEGIRAEALPRIFERFWRDDEAHTTAGFGLGLPMAQKIVERLGGRIEVASAVGKGSRFQIVLPVEQPQLALTTSA